MTALWTADQIASATGGTTSGDFACDGVAFDSREVGQGDLFFALRGEASDSHRFLSTAFANGASGAVVSTAVAEPHVLVADTTEALESLAKAARARTHGVIVGVTGSAGKTGTKEALFLAFDRISRGRAHRSVKSYNNHVGVPLSLTRMPEATRFGVFEMGMNHAGELAALTRIVRPHIAIVTTIAPAHAEFFRDESEIADAKGEIFEGLEAYPGFDAGIAIIPFDSPHRERLVTKAQSCGATVVTFGRGEGADVRAIDVVRAPDGGSLVTARLGDATLCYTVAAPGEHWVANSLAVLAAVKAAGGDIAIAALALAELPGLPGRGERHLLPHGEGDVLLIDESYNANPASMAATLADLGQVAGRRRIAVLGAMKELGSGSAAYHAALAPQLIAAGVSHALLVGAEMAPLADALARDAASGLRAQLLGDAGEALAALQPLLAPGDAVLVKGSNSVGLARIVAAIVANPAKRDD